MNSWCVMNPSFFRSSFSNISRSSCKLIPTNLLAEAPFEKGTSSPPVRPCVTSLCFLLLKPDDSLAIAAPKTSLVSPCVRAFAAGAGFCLFSVRRDGLPSLTGVNALFSMRYCCLFSRLTEVSRRPALPLGGGLASRSTVSPFLSGGAFSFSFWI